ncbi:HAD-IIB family hydrolase [Mesobacterium pallidum]|uniref:HAD-IIB family hydrolase n=1 Tax=Mesobacterium pallidum TaxID=2872037 RepID=UPI001EE2F21A|nr:HAD-IIB family hydrolase [Mesobacterium pallidum]
MVGGSSDGDTNLRLTVFTDLDGTLLDHGSYSHAPAAPAIAALKARGAAIVLASSKTAAEILPLHAELGLGDAPIIAENGAALVRPGEGTPETSDYTRLRAALDALPPELRAPFRGFGDMSAEEVAADTGLPLASATLAKERLFSEPGRWLGTDDQRTAFAGRLSAKGITARHGGRYLTLSFGGTKASQMDAVTRMLHPDVTIALGDAPNDIEMLEAADYGIVIRNDHGPGLPALTGEALGRIRRSTAPGPQGWAEEILALIAQLERQEGRP